jgi:hypothetical protein
MESRRSRVVHARSGGPTRKGQAMLVQCDCTPASPPAKACRSVFAAERFIRGELRKRFGRNYRRKFQIKASEADRAISVHWENLPDAVIIEVEAIGKPFVTNGTLSFFQTHHD